MNQLPWVVTNTGAEARVGDWGRLRVMWSAVGGRVRAELVRGDILTWFREVVGNEEPIGIMRERVMKEAEEAVAMHLRGWESVVSEATVYWVKSVERAGERSEAMVNADNCIGAIVHGMTGCHRDYGGAIYGTSVAEVVRELEALL